MLTHYLHQKLNGATIIASNNDWYDARATWCPRKRAVHLAFQLMQSKTALLPQLDATDFHLGDDTNILEDSVEATDRKYIIGVLQPCFTMSSGLVTTVRPGLSEHTNVIHRIEFPVLPVDADDYRRIHEMVLSAYETVLNLGDKIDPVSPLFVRVWEKSKPKSCFVSVLTRMTDLSPTASSVCFRSSKEVKRIFLVVCTSLRIISETI